MIQGDSQRTGQFSYCKLFFPERRFRQCDKTFEIPPLIVFLSSVKRRTVRNEAQFSVSFSVIKISIMTIPRCIIAAFLSISIYNGWTAEPPRIYTLSTNSGRIGESLTIFGDDFLPDKARVLVGGAFAPVISGNVAYLEIEIPGGALPGPISVTQEGLMATSATYFNPLPASPGTLTNLFAMRELSRKSGFLPSGEVADLDGDGKLDLIVAHQKSLELFQNQTCAGLFSSNAFVSVSLPLKELPFTIVARDLNGDGKPELVTIEGDTLNIRQNLIGDAQMSSNSFSNPLLMKRRDFLGPLQVADVDHDGRPDILAASSGGIQVFWNKSGDQSLSENDFTNTFTIVSNSGQKSQNARAFKVVDLNQDGHADIAAIIGPNLVIFALHDQSGMLRTNLISSFVLGPATATDFTPAFAAFAVADLDGNGVPDLIVTQSSAVVGYLNHSSADHFNASSFEKVQLISSGFHSIIPADFDGDGQIDLLVENRFLFKLTLENGKLVPQNFSTSILLRPEATLIALGDLNGDNRPEAIGLSSAAGSALVVLQNLADSPPSRLELRLISNRRTLAATGQPLTTMHVQSSGDLSHWRTVTSLFVNISGESMSTVIDSAPMQFYRLTQ
jgi:hypothetical protein